MVVVVVVPPLPKGDERQEAIVSAGIARLVPAATEDMAQRVDGEGAMPKQNGGDEETHHEHRQPTDEEETNAQQDGRHQVEAVEKTQLGEGGEVLDAIEASISVLVAQDPADVAPP